MSLPISASCTWLTQVVFLKSTFPNQLLQQWWRQLGEIAAASDYSVELIGADCDDDSARSAAPPFGPAGSSAAVVHAETGCWLRPGQSIANFWKWTRPSSSGAANASYPSHCSNYFNSIANVLPSVSSVATGEWTEILERI